jgi:hypothetical protein
VQCRTKPGQAAADDMRMGQDRAVLTGQGRGFKGRCPETPSRSRARSCFGISLDRSR